MQLVLDKTVVKEVSQPPKRLGSGIADVVSPGVCSFQIDSEATAHPKM